MGGHKFSWTATLMDVQPLGTPLGTVKQAMPILQNFIHLDIENSMLDSRDGSHWTRTLVLAVLQHPSNHYTIDNCLKVRLVSSVFM